MKQGYSGGGPHCRVVAYQFPEQETREQIGGGPQKLETPVIPPKGNVTNGAMLTYMVTLMHSALTILACFLVRGTQILQA